MNGLIPSQQRASILSFDSMLGSTGGVVVQPVLGRAADVWGYPGSYLLGAGHLGARAAVRLPLAPAARAGRLHGRPTPPIEPTQAAAQT